LVAVLVLEAVPLVFVEVTVLVPLLLVWLLVEVTV